ncbi:MAG: phospholipase C [Candidatus Binataceae bacterium]
MRFSRVLARLTGALAITALVGGTARATATPIQHVVVIFQENISFDHYFGTYPNAANPSGEPAFEAAPGTPTVNGLSQFLLSNNPNKFNPANGAGATNPFRLDPSEAGTSDQNHAYNPEQMAADMGLMDLFPSAVGNAGPPPGTSPPVGTKGLTMGYFDGNTVTAMWNYAQRFALSDNSYGSTFGPSSVGAMNLVSGQTNGVLAVLNPSGSFETPDGNGGLTVINDPDPIGDVCSSPTRNQVKKAGKNIGDLLSAAGISWGAFMGGFNLSTKNANGTTGCARSTDSTITGTTADYIAHHMWFQYYPTTANPTHVRPTSATTIGQAGDPANHQYDLDDFTAAVQAGNMPAVSFLKAIAIQDGHAGYSDPLDEQTYVVNMINFLEKTPEWKSTAIIIAYDDSDGWYDHQMGPIVNQSSSPQDGLTGTGTCGTGDGALPGVASGTAHAQGRCGYGPRLPLLVVSPWAKENFVDHSVTDQSSVLRFIEDNWLSGERIGGGSFDSLAGSIENMFDFSHRNIKKLILDPTTGEKM